MKPYNKQNIPLAKNLRKNMTPWERKLWYDFLRDYPVRFQRQKAIGNYIVDFYCAKARLVIELDGSGHYEPEQAQADAIRSQQLNQLNLTVLRFSNLDIYRNFSGVCTYIDDRVRSSLPQSASLTAPSSEGAFRCVYAIGVFDGVHIGHQALLTQCKNMAKQLGCDCGVITFCIHPDILVKGDRPALISTVEDRISILKNQYGIDHVVTLTFDQKLMNMPWESFYDLLKTQYGAAGIVCGDDFRFGYKGQGTAALLQQRCAQDDIPCVVVPEQAVDGVRISSTYIRNCIEEGRMEEAVRFLGHPYRITGTVIPGRQLGRTIGIPTANIQIPEGLVIPKFGVYACKIGSHMAVTNVGTRPTVNGDHVTVEPWILDFDGDLYGRSLQLDFYKFLRPEQKFGSLEELKAEIQKNAAQTRKFFEKK